MEEGIAVKSVKILDILPTIAEDRGTPGHEDRTRLAQSLLEETGGLLQFDFKSLDSGSQALDSRYEIALTAPYILRTAKEAEAEGYQAVILDCFLDPALDALREHLSIPVFGPCLSSCSLAIRLGGDYSIIGLSDQLNALILDNLRKYQMDRPLRSIRSVNIPLEELHLDRASSVQGLVEACQTAVQEDHARALVFGCTCFSPLADLVRQELQSRGIQVPIIESLRATLLDAFSCVMQELSQSQSTYRPVREKPRRLDWNENGQISGGISKKAEACV